MHAMDGLIMKPVHTYLNKLRQECGELVAQLTEIQRRKFVGWLAQRAIDCADVPPYMEDVYRIAVLRIHQAAHGKRLDVSIRNQAKWGLNPSNAAQQLILCALHEDSFIAAKDTSYLMCCASGKLAAMAETGFNKKSCLPDVVKEAWELARSTAIADEFSSQQVWIKNLLARNLS